MASDIGGNDVAFNIPINAVLDGFNNAMEGVKSSVSGTMDNVKAKMSEVKEAFGAVGLMAGNALKDAVEVAAKGQQNFADLQATIKSTGGAAGYTADQIKSMAGDLSHQTTFSAGEIMKGQNMLLTFTNISGKVYKDASMAMLDLSQKMGTAPQQTAIQLGKALNDPIKGITALTRVGVTFTEQQKQQIQTMESAGNMAGAQEVIIKELNKEFGGQAAAQLNTYSGQIKLLQNNLTSMKAAIGSAVLPYLQEFLSEINKGIEPVISFIQAHAKMAAAILASTAAIGTLVGGFALFQKISGILGPAVSGITGLLGSLTLPVAGIIAGIGLLVAAYVNNFGGLKTFLDGIFGSIKTLFTTFSDDMKSGLTVFTSLHDAVTKAFGPEIGDMVAQVFSKIIDTFRELESNVITIWDNLKDIFSGLVNLIKSNMPNIESIFKSTFSIISNVVTNVLIPVLKNIVAIVGNVVSFIKENWGTISTIITAVFTAVRAAYSSILVPVLNGIIKILGTVLNFVTSNKMVLDGILTLFMARMSMVGAQAVLNGAKVISGFVSSLVTAGTQAVRAAAQIAVFIAGMLKTGLEAAVNGAKVVGSFIASMITAGAQAVANGAKIVGSFVASIITAGAESVATGVKIVASFVANMIVAGAQSVIAAARIGLVTAAQWALNAAMDANPIGIVILAIAALIAAGVALYENWGTVKKAAGEAWQAIKNAFAPLATWGKDAFGWGKDMLNGFINGIKGGFGELADAAKDIGDTIKSYLHFSVPDQGPLTDYETWMPDFMQGLSNGITANKFKVANAIKGLTSDMSVGIKAMPVLNNLQQSTKPQLIPQAINADKNINLSMNVDGKVWAQASLKYTELTQGRNNKFVARRYGVTNG